MTHYATSLPHTGDRLSNFDRVKVDVAQTGFFEGREFRSFKEFSLAASGLYVVQVVVPGDVILMGLSVTVDSGWLRVGTYAGGTPSGTFSETLPIISKNNMSTPINRRAVVTPTLVLTAGGGHTGGAEIDVLRVRTANQNNQVTTVGVGVDDVRGVAAGTYYFRFLNLSSNDTCTGVFHTTWEQRNSTL